MNIRFILLTLLVFLSWSCAPAPEKQVPPEESAPPEMIAEVPVPEAELPRETLVPEPAVAPKTVIPEPKSQLEKVPPLPVPVTPEPEPVIVPEEPAVVLIPEVVVPGLPAPVISVFTRFGIKELPQQGIIDKTSRKITFQVPFGTPLGSLTPQWTTDADQVLLNGQPVNSGSPVAAWNTPRKFTLVSSDGTESEWTAEVKVTPANKDSKLAQVDLGGYDLIPAFDPAVTSYSFSIPEYRKTMPVSAVASFAKATLTVQMNDSLEPLVLKSGQPLTVNLKDGENSFFLKVLAEDKRTNTYYVFVMKRR